MLIGTIMRLQVQRGRLKSGTAEARRYDPAPVEPVTRLELDPGGVVGRDGRGERLMDIHHRGHPDSRNRRGENGISIGFITHYRLMRERFGAHLCDGVAGENILIETDKRFVEADLPEALIIESASGQRIELTGVQVAEPCLEFTRFALGGARNSHSDQTVRDALDFLRRGMRGYYAHYPGVPAEIALGNRLHAAPQATVP